jgi:hypothetical protein
MERWDNKERPNLGMLRMWRNKETSGVLIIYENHRCLS